MGLHTQILKNLSRIPLKHIGGEANQPPQKHKHAQRGEERRNLIGEYGRDSDTDGEEGSRDQDHTEIR